MLELMLCSLFTIVPDYLYRRYRQGKRLGHEITLFSVWYELRWGITGCLMLTLLLITIVFYHHPSTTSVTAAYRVIPILPETSGRVSEIYVGLSDEIEKGKPILKLDSTAQEAALEVARRRIVEVDAQMQVAKADIAAAEGQIQQAQSAYEQAVEELQTKEELQRRSPGVVAQRDIERLRNVVEGRQGGIVAAQAGKAAAETRLSTLLPAEKASTEATLRQAEVDLAKTVVYAGVAGRVEQFTLRVGDIVNPFMRPGGVLIPKEGGRKALVAGFGQIESQVMKVGMAAEVTCLARPLEIIPMVVTQVQDYVASGQVRTGDQLFDVQQLAKPGTITVFLEPLYQGGLDGVTPGSNCIANAYTSNHERLATETLGIGTYLYLHLVDTVALVHGIILRAQALLLPIKTLVLTGH